MFYTQTYVPCLRVYCKPDLWKKNGFNSDSGLISSFPFLIFWLILESCNPSIFPPWTNKTFILPRTLSDLQPRPAQAKTPHSRLPRDSRGRCRVLQLLCLNLLPCSRLRRQGRSWVLHLLETLVQPLSRLGPWVGKQEVLHLRTEAWALPSQRPAATYARWVPGSGPRGEKRGNVWLITYGCYSSWVASSLFKRPWLDKAVNKTKVLVFVSLIISERIKKCKL